MLLPFGMEQVLTEPKKPNACFPNRSNMLRGFGSRRSLDSVLGKLYYAAEWGSKVS